MRIPSSACGRIGSSGPSVAAICSLLSCYSCSLAVQVPMLLAGVIGGLANGFPLWLSFSEALSQNVYFLIGFTLPIFAFVSLTRSTSEALGVAFVIVVANILGTEALILPISGSPLGPTSNTGLAWIPLTWRFAIYFVAALAILVLQYFRRATRASRLVLAASVVICLFTATCAVERRIRMAKSDRPSVCRGSVDCGPLRSRARSSSIRSAGLRCCDIQRSSGRPAP